jgi:cell division septum initiation protein DivIVA
VGRKPPRPAEHRPTWPEPTSPDAIGHATAQNGAFAPPSATPSRRRVRRAGTRGSRPSTQGSNADLGLALFTASTALHCARLDLLGGDIATAEEELGRAYDALASSPEADRLPPTAEPLAELLRGREAGEIPRAADGHPASDAVEPQAYWPAVRRSALDWREQADAAERRARDALELARIGAAFMRLSDWQARNASRDGERPASAERAWPARRAVGPAPDPAREGVLREILANEALSDGCARELALELLDLPEELWAAKARSTRERQLPAEPASPASQAGCDRKLAQAGDRPGRSGIGHTRPVADDEAPYDDEEESRPPPPSEEGGGLPDLRARVPAAIRDVAFPSAGRGYERRAVDSYVNQVNRLIAELEVGRSPQAAVRHALERVGEQTKGLLQQARETAEEMTASAREEADEQLARAKAEAEETTTAARAAEARTEEIVAKAKSDAAATLAGAKAEADDIIARAQAEAEDVLARSRAEAAERLQRLEEEIAAAREQAEARMHELHAETEAVWKERHDLLDEIHAMGTRLLEVASMAAARVSPAEASEEATPEAAPAAEAESAQA